MNRRSISGPRWDIERLAADRACDSAAETCNEPLGNAVDEPLSRYLSSDARVGSEDEKRVGISHVDGTRCFRQYIEGAVPGETPSKCCGKPFAQYSAGNMQAPPRAAFADKCVECHNVERIAAMSVTRNNHYVPQWYQEGFFEPGRSSLAYLDMKLDQKVLADGRVITLRGAWDETPTSIAFRQKDL